jgi:hypothetical protein
MIKIEVSALQPEEFEQDVYERVLTLCQLAEAADPRAPACFLACYTTQRLAQVFERLNAESGAPRWVKASSHIVTSSGRKIRVGRNVIHGRVFSHAVIICSAGYPDAQTLTRVLASGLGNEARAVFVFDPLDPPQHAHKLRGMAR